MSEHCNALLLPSLVSSQETSRHSSTSGNTTPQPVVRCSIAAHKSRKDKSALDELEVTLASHTDVAQASVGPQKKGLAPDAKNFCGSRQPRLAAACIRASRDSLQVQQQQIRAACDPSVALDSPQDAHPEDLHAPLEGLQCESEHGTRATRASHVPPDIKSPAKRHATAGEHLQDPFPEVSLHMPGHASSDCSLDERLSSTVGALQDLSEQLKGLLLGHDQQCCSLAKAAEPSMCACSQLSIANAGPTERLNTLRLSCRAAMDGNGREHHHLHSKDIDDLLHRLQQSIETISQSRQCDGGDFSSQHHDWEVGTTAPAEAKGFVRMGHPKAVSLSETACSNLSDVRTCGQHPSGRQFPVKLCQAVPKGLLAHFTAGSSITGMSTISDTIVRKLQADELALKSSCSIDVDAQVKHLSKQQAWHREGAVDCGTEETESKGISRRRDSSVGPMGIEGAEARSSDVSIEELIQGSLQRIDRVAGPFLEAVDTPCDATELPVVFAGHTDSVDELRSRRRGLLARLDAVQKFAAVSTASSAGESMALSAGEIKELMRRKQDNDDDLHI
jgi:hypothetical protein